MRERVTSTQRPTLLTCCCADPSFFNIEGSDSISAHRGGVTGDARRGRKSCTMALQGQQHQPSGDYHSWSGGVHIVLRTASSQQKPLKKGSRAWSLPRLTSRLLAQTLLSLLPFIPIRVKDVEVIHEVSCHLYLPLQATGESWDTF